MSILSMRASAAFVFVVSASIATSVHSANGSPYTAQSIVPGQRIGSLQLKSYTGSLPLGKPDASDAGMSHYHYLWVSKRHERGQTRTYTTFAAAVSNAAINGGRGERIGSIRVTSPYFRTASGISVGSTLADAKRRYSHLVPDRDRTNVLIDARAGIAFEYSRPHPSSSSQCIAITVFKPRNPQVFTADQVKDLLSQV